MSCMLFLNTPSNFSDGNPIATMFGLMSGGKGVKGKYHKTCAMLMRMVSDGVHYLEYIFGMYV